MRATHASAYGLALGLPVGLLAVQSLIAAAADVREVSMAAVTTDRGDRAPARRNRGVWIRARRPAAIDPPVTLRRQ